MSQESSATELEVAMLYSEVLAESDDENDVWLRRLHEGVAVAKAVVAERKAAVSGGGASSFGSPSQLKRPAPDGAQSASAADAFWWRAFFRIRMARRKLMWRSARQRFGAAAALALSGRLRS